MRKLRFSLIVFFVFLYGQVFAQLAEPVKWSFSQKKVADDEVLLIFKANVEAKIISQGKEFKD